MNFAELSIKRPIFITSVAILTMVLGFFSLKKMAVDLFPDVTFPVLSIQTAYPGASPADIERQVSKPIEDELSSLSRIDSLYSKNLDGISLIIVKFELGSDIKDLEQQVRQKLGNIRRDLPADIKEPMITRFDIGATPVAWLAVVSSMESSRLYDMVSDSVKPRIEVLDGIGGVEIAGGRKKEIQVLVDKKRLEDRRISILQVVEKIKNTSKDVPIGKIDSGNSQTTFRTAGQFDSLEELKKVNISFIGSDRPVRLDAIADVQEGLEDRDFFNFSMKKAEDFKMIPMVGINVYKQSGASTIKLVDALLQLIPKINKEMKEKGIDLKVELVSEMARPIRSNVNDVRESILYGILLTIIVVFFFLGSFRSTFITAMAIPNSLLGAFIAMYVAGFSINLLTLLAMSLAVGLLIDDAIVVRENIFRHMELGFSPIEAAIKGTQEVSLAVVATTCVVIAVFGPVAFMDGIVGQFFKQFGLTMVFIMIISLFDAFTMAPMLSAYMASPNEHNRKGFWGRFFIYLDRFHGWVEDKYELTIKWVLKNNLKTIGIATVFFFASLWLIKFIPKNFLPPVDNGEFRITIEMPVGTNLVTTKEITDQIVNKAKNHPAVSALAGFVGGASANLIEPNKAMIYVGLVPRKERKEVTSRAKEDMRELLSSFTNVHIAVSDYDPTGGGEKPFIFGVTGYDLVQLSTYVDKLKKRIEKIPGLVDVETTYRQGKPEFHVDFDRSKSEDLGVSAVVAGAELRTRVDGGFPGVFRRDDKEYNIRVRLRESDRDIRKEFNSTRVPNVNFDMIPLPKIATGKSVLGYSQIERLNKKRIVSIDGNLGIGGNLGDVMVQVEKIVAEKDMTPPPGISFSVRGQGERLNELRTNIAIAIFLGVIIIYLVLSSLYESFITPLTILLALPLAVVGAMMALFITQKSIDLFSLIGIVLLMGVVAKNSILLVDYTQQLVARGLSRDEALLKACRTRLRPILMTSFALIAGAIPIAVGLSEVASQRSSMGVAIIGGLLSSTLLTLVVVPAAFGYIDDFRQFLGRFLSKLKGSPSKAGS